MNFKAEDVGRISFRKSAFGYNKEDVNDFLEKLAEDYSEAEVIISDFNIKVEKLKSERDHYRKVADSIQIAMANVQEESGRIKAEAAKKASDMVNEAERKVNEINNEALLELAKIRCEIDETKKRINLYRQKAEAMMKSQLEAFKWMNADSGGVTDV